VARGAVVDGDIAKTNFAAWFTVAGWIVLVLWWLAVTVSLLIVGILFVLFPKAAQTVAAVGANRPGSAWRGARCWESLSRYSPVPWARLSRPPTGVGHPLDSRCIPVVTHDRFILGRTSPPMTSPFLIGFAILRGAIIPARLLIGFLGGVRRRRCRRAARPRLRCSRSGSEHGRSSP
jgi:hypothetical protein